MRRTLKRTLAICGLFLGAEAWVSRHAPRAKTSSSRHHLAVDPWLAGAFSGAVGVGVAFPLDTLKTKQQVLSSSRDSQTMLRSPSAEDTVSGTRTRLNADGSLTATALSATATAVSSSSNNNNSITMWYVFCETWKQQGWAGFFGGVQTSMMGQAVIKSVAFAVNSSVLTYLASSSSPYQLDAHSSLLVPAATAGFVTAFLAVPCDRIKVLMQCQDGECQCNDWDCLRDVLQCEGVSGLFFRGLGPTLCREVPAYTIYFALYGALLEPVSRELTLVSAAAAAPLLCGAIAGASCVLPVYPVDVVKTLVQNTHGNTDTTCQGSGSSPTTWQVVQSVYERQGFMGFWDGLTPRMLRAAVNHAVTFATYEWMMSL